ncbi:MAG: type II toxin-antitoxin system PrlF family antitoxin [Micrococcales bacterium]
MNDKEPLVSAESTLTDRYQTTIPEVVRKALRLTKRDKLEFLLDENGAVRLQKAAAPQTHQDPTLAAFLDLLAKDIEKNPQNLREVDESFWLAIDKLTADVEVDLDEKISFEPGENDDWLYPDIKP